MDSKLMKRVLSLLLVFAVALGVFQPLDSHAQEVEAKAETIAVESKQESTKEENPKVEEKKAEEKVEANKSEEKKTEASAEKVEKKAEAPKAEEKKEDKEENKEEEKKSLIEETTEKQKEAAKKLEEEKQKVEAAKIREVNLHAGADAQTMGNLTWTTYKLGLYTAEIYDQDGNQLMKYNVAGKSNNVAYNYSVVFSGLKAGKTYTYRISAEGVKAVTGKFRTAPTQESKEKISFAYLGDPQVKDYTTAKSTGALFHQLTELSKKDPLNFVYIAGDHTNNGSYEDTADEVKEEQWKDFFHNAGQYPQATQKFLLEHTLLSTQGNHDLADFNGHITPASEIGQGEFLTGVYSVDYGPVRIVMLNDASYNTDDLANNKNFQKMTKFLQDQVEEGKKKGLWTVVGFHKPLYTGASHINDGDVIEYRKALNPILSGLDVDMILAGHDHVYARGFINAKGENSDRKSVV